MEQAKPSDPDDLLMRMTLGEFFGKMGYSHYFIHYYVLPVCGAIWSCPTNTALEFPAYFILSFMKNHHLLQVFDRPRWSTVSGRSREYVKKVSAPFADKIHLNTPIAEANRLPFVQIELIDSSKVSQGVYDKVIFACHAPEALKIAKGSLAQEQAEYLSKFDYVDNDIWLHQDAKLLPANKSVWSSWNFLGDNQDKVCVSYLLNMLQNIPYGSNGLPTIVTLNPPSDKYPTVGVFDRFSMAHPVPTTASARAQFDTPKIQGLHDLYFAGAYQGFGFHEDGAKAGMEAAYALLNTPWAAIPNHPRFLTSISQRAAQVMVHRFFSSFIKYGRLQISELGGDIHIFGDGIGPHCNITLTSPKFYTNILMRYDLGVADSYVDGIMRTPDLKQFIELIIHNRDSYSEANGGKVGYLFSSLLSLSLSYIDHNYLKRNSTKQTRKNISAHYDLGNEFFKIILDKSMTYSCGIYRNPTDSLYEAQMNKIQNLVSKARVRGSDRVLEIGFGWGSLSIYLAKKIGCKVTGLSLSSEQKKYAESLVEKEGLSHLINYELIDYRLFNPTEKYNRILSCEMLEAVGHEFFGAFFSSCQRLMKPDGIMVIQVITVPDNRYDEYRNGVDFIQEYIFPGGLCPSLSALTEAMKKDSDLMVEHIENIGPHYATTLDAWCKNMMDNVDKLPGLGMGIDDRFIRIWEYYFRYCEAGFATRTLSVLQIVFTRPNNSNLNLPLTEELLDSA